MQTRSEPDEATAARRDWMSVLARAPAAALGEAFAALGPEPAFDWLRRPEFGTVMLQGRAGGNGAPFNLGEMTVTRCALRLADGREGHAHVPGRSADHARRAALCDALLQGPEAPGIRTAVLAPLSALLDAAARDRAGKAAATKVEFFTMVRGENA